MAKPVRRADQSRLRGEGGEVGGDGAGGSHHGTSTIGLSCRRRLLQMRTQFYVQDRAMQVPQGRLHLRVLTISGAVHQRRTQDPTGQTSDNSVRAHRGGGYRETKEAARAHEGREYPDACRRRGKR